MKIEDNRHSFSLPKTQQQNNSLKFDELLKHYTEEAEQEIKLNSTIETTVNTAFNNPNLT